ncbi:MAG TPA: GyrI-like domain-containing protein [Cyclobacteriaceae bacterium]
MTPRIETTAEKKLIGNYLKMSLANNKTGELWKNFIPRRKEITTNRNTDLISMAVYNPSYFVQFNPVNEFEKWAAVEVENFENIPADMESFTLAGGLYAIFDYTGSSNDPSVFQYIFGTWLPNSKYVLDNRPHVEVLGAKYKNNDPTSEEEIWIPIKEKP